MSWIKITRYMPGDHRIIQIWNAPKGNYNSEPEGNCVGYYDRGSRWFGRNEAHGYITNLTHVTHWAEMLGKPEDHE